MDRYRMLPSYRYYDVEGTSPLTLDKAVGKPLRDYKIYGNSIQDGTPSPDTPVEVQSFGDKSKNLFNEELLVKYSSGVIEKTESGYLVKKYPYSFTSVIATEKLFIDYIKSILKPNVTYTLSRKTANYTNGSDGAIQIRGNDNTKVFVTVTLGLGVKSATFTLTQEQIDSISNVYIYGRADNPVLFEYIQLEEGETATEYEPYGYKIPIKVGGKNLFDAAEFADVANYTSASNKDYVSVDGDKITISNKATIQITSDIFKRLKPNTAYSISIKNRIIEEGETNSSTFRIALTGAGVSNFYLSYGANYNNRVLPSDLSGYTRLCLFGSADGVVSFEGIQIEESETATPYEPYKEPIVTNIYLDEPLYKIGDYADYIDFKNGKVVRNINKISVNGTEDWAADTTKELTQVFKLKDVYLNPTPISYRCNRFIASNPGDTEKVAITLYIFIAINKTRVSTVNEFKEWLSENPTDVFYNLYTPTETSITLPTTPTHKGTNVISVPTDIQPSNMQIQYYK